MIKCVSCQRPIDGQSSITDNLGRIWCYVCIRHQLTMVQSDARITQPSLRRNKRPI